MPTLVLFHRRSVTESETAATGNPNSITLKGFSFKRGLLLTFWWLVLILTVVYWSIIKVCQLRQPIAFIPTSQQCPYPPYFSWLVMAEMWMNHLYIMPLSALSQWWSCGGENWTIWREMRKLLPTFHRLFLFCIWGRLNLRYLTNVSISYHLERLEYKIQLSRWPSIFHILPWREVLQPSVWSSQVSGLSEQRTNVSTSSSADAGRNDGWAERGGSLW